ncbi:ketoacyl-ACP synthase III [bacterium]|nr:ketoacyl-ACP synthase III [bacterium]
MSETAKNGLYRSWISGTGSFLPEKKLTNFDLEKIVETNNEWIVERTGIESRSIAEDGVATSDLALIASHRALEMAGLAVKDIDMILFATVSPDYPMPSSACELQRKMGARNVMAFDLSAACSGFLYGLSIADQFIRTGHYKNILVVGAEILHNWINYDDRQTCILFGDAAGAAIVSRAPAQSPSAILSSHMFAEGDLADLLYIPAGGSKMPNSQQTIEQKLNKVAMKGREIFKHAVRTMSTCCEIALDANGLKKEDVDWVIPHQANTRIIEAVAKHFGISMDKVVLEIADMGNTSAATIPVALDRAARDGRIQRGQNVVMTAFGAGLTSGSVMMRF